MIYSLGLPLGIETGARFLDQRAREVNLEWPGLVAQMAKNLSAMQETQVRSLVEKIPGEGNGNPLQYSCLGNPMDRGAWLAVVHGITKE